MKNTERGVAQRHIAELYPRTLRFPARLQRDHTPVEGIVCTLRNGIGVLNPKLVVSETEKKPIQTRGVALFLADR